MKLNDRQQEILLNLLLEKMQEIAENNNTDVRKALAPYKQELYTIYGMVVDYATP